VHRPDSVGASAIENLPAVASHFDQSNLMKHSYVLRHGRLGEAKRRRDITNGAFARSEIDQDVSTSRFSDSVENV
jgi:hypothetical protein